MASVTLNSKDTPYTVRISSRSHDWRADEPLDRGGADHGPTPFEMLLGAVGSCTLITAQMYALRKEWDLRAISAQASFSKVDAEDCPDCDTDSGKVSVIEIEIELEGSLTSEQRDRILEIAGRCPVKKAVEGEVKVRTSLA